MIVIVAEYDPDTDDVGEIIVTHEFDIQDDEVDLETGE